MSKWNLSIPKDESEPKENFTGYWVPVEIIQMFENRIINLQEMHLWAMIRSLTNHKKRIPCWASNGYLAEKMQVRPQEISQRISNLKEVGLVKQVGFNGRIRFMVVRNPESEEVQERIEGSRLVKKRQKRQQKKSESNGESRLPENRKAALRKTGTNIEKSIGEESKDSSPNRVSRKRGLGLVSEPPVELREILAIKLTESIKKKKMLPPRTRKTAWMKVLRILINTYGQEEVQTVSEWYCKNVCREMVPEAYQSATFKQKYPAIKRAMERFEGPQLEISDKTKKAAERVYSSFPPGDRKPIEVMLQRSVDEFNYLRDRCKELAKEEPKLKFLTEQILNNLYPISAAEEHALRISGRRNLNRSRLWEYAFKLDEKFLAQFRECCSSDKLWKKFVEGVLNED